jgi:hypothetical protein
MMEHDEESSYERKGFFTEMDAVLAWARLR